MSYSRRSKVFFYLTATISSFRLPTADIIARFFFYHLDLLVSLHQDDRELFLDDHCIDDPSPTKTNLRIRSFNTSPSAATIFFIRLATWHCFFRSPTTIIFTPTSTSKTIIYLQDNCLSSITNNAENKTTL